MEGQMYSDSLPMVPSLNPITDKAKQISSNNPNDHEDLLEVDKLSVCLYVEYQEAVDIQEAL
jgi:hypothetical protein